jgi:hypothetical protein
VNIIGYKVFTGTGTLEGATADLSGATIAIIEGYTSIGDQAFRTATNLTSITIPASVTSIGDSAFYNALSLTSINIPAGVTSIGSSAFRNTGITNVLYNENNTMLVYYPPSLNNTTFTIPASVTSIGSSAFQAASSLTSITIPASVTSIGQSAFNNSGLNIVYIENGQVINGNSITSHFLWSKCYYLSIRL